MQRPTLRGLMAAALFSGASLLAPGLAPAAAAAEPFKCPHVGGDFVFGQEANVNSLDQMTSSTISTRNVAMNIFETLMTRDENNKPILDLAASMDEAPDHLTYTFKLRPGIKFHNGKPLTSADVSASFERYSKVGLARSMLANVANWETPDPMTFVIHMKKAQPTFIDQLSSFSIPIVIFPAEYKDDPPQQLHTIGTGPWMLDQFVPGSFVKLKRYDGYKPNTAFTERTGFGGYKQACFDTVTFRIVTEPGARVAGLKTGELQGVEDVPTKALSELKTDKNITLLPLPNWWIQLAQVNTSQPPTDNLAFRRAVQAALDMDEIMDAATDGNYKLNVGFQFPGRSTYTDAGKETYNLHDPALVKKYLAEAGYKGEPVTLLTNQDYASMYNAALVMQQQLKADGINAQLKVVDWPTSVQMSLKADSGWNFFFTGWGTQPALGPLDTMAFLAPPYSVYMPKDKAGDPNLVAAWNDMNQLPTPEERQAAFARMQKIVLDQVYIIPFGSLTKVQAVRSNVDGFKPFRIPRVSNVWFAN
ncbi:MAG: ABC transporter substrate-binding protein [Proteobacteria bacterium]|nr:ABC transporter substrate-binding protein [Pseudomonadota bacterium]